MSLFNGQSTGPPPISQYSVNNKGLNPLDDGSARNSNMSVLMPEASIDVEEENRRALFAELYHQTEDRISLIFGDDGGYNRDAIRALTRASASGSATSPAVLPPTTDHEPIKEPPLKKAKRTIDEDDYDDDDEEEDEQPQPSSIKSQNAAAASSLLSPSKSGSSPVQSVNSPDKRIDKIKGQDGLSDRGKPADESNKSLEETQKAIEEAARKTFHTIIYPLENDRAAMLEQQRLEDTEKQLQAEMDHNGHTSGGQQASNQGTLSSANLGASSLTLKHLIARIDAKRDQVAASDAELRLLMNEVRKNRSKWASEENVNQEELYEALEKVLTELKAHTEYSTPFLTKVSKREAPNYSDFVKNPMDMGTMTKKLKSLTYKSKAEFVTDLNLIWDNCLKYNQDMNSPLRRMANGMRKEADKLIPLIPDLVVRSRAEVEAEERRKHNGGEDDAGDDSDDEPIMSSRGRKTGTKGANKSRKAPNDKKEDTPAIDQKPLLQVNGILGKHGREDSEAFDGSNGFSTPVGRSNTPGMPNGVSNMGSNADAIDVDGSTLSGMALNQAFGEAAEQAFESEEYKIWKQTTKKDRALVSKERNLLFKENKLNAEASAALRTKAAMRRFLKHQVEAESQATGADLDSDAHAAPVQDSANKPSETLAEGIAEEVERVLPDYYDTLSNIPDIEPKFRWIEDGEGHVINQHEDFLHTVAPGSFVAPHSRLAKKIDNNIHQIQETRKLSSKISVIKQMQVQTQVYANQFPKSNHEPFIEQDIEPHFISDNGPVMASDTCQNALKRSITKILYHAGFEETQPSAVDAFTSIAADYFQKLVKTFNVYQNVEKKAVQTPSGVQIQSRFTPEEIMLHTLDENGFDVVTLDTYIKDELDRHSSKLGALHDRMKVHLTDLLRPALAGEASNDGVGAFKDGADTFVSGDFADDLGEDFFGFKALGLDQELGGALGVPFHLLQSRVRNQYQMQTQTSSSTTTDLFSTLDPLEAVTRENIQDQIGLVKNFFLAKLHANGDQPLVEDEDLPVKQRKPRPRLGASGKIVSAQKRPPKEQLALAKKKKKMEAAAAEAKLNAAALEKAGSVNNTPSKKKSLSMPNGAAPNPAVLALAPSMERADSTQSQGGTSQTDKEEGMGMMSPESIAP
ncbi:unnamed protein product [Clonostachys rosea f. rosea IK726]|uniref:Bromo domain-containing protein n=2 Tax=Bionectria ochroleuca TaxID=29856 RepID=A0A0B7JP05_BIOOC|nr:unnamed protein product [Clonostachys rosea f. rosea IK726]